MQNNKGNTVLHCADEKFKDNDGSEEIMSNLIKLELIDIKKENLARHSQLHYTVKSGNSERITSEVRANSLYKDYAAKYLRPSGSIDSAFTYQLS